jgi:hypothetical protein
MMVTFILGLQAFVSGRKPQLPGIIEIIFAFQFIFTHDRR